MFLDAMPCFEDIHYNGNGRTWHASVMLSEELMIYKYGKCTLFSMVFGVLVSVLDTLGFNKELMITGETAVRRPVG